MASLFKKKLHRKSQNLQQEPLGDRGESAGGLEPPIIRATPYDSTTSGNLPERGAYPIKADGSSTVTRGNFSSQPSKGQQGISKGLPFPSSTSNQTAAVGGQSHMMVDPRIDVPYHNSPHTGEFDATRVKDRIGGRNIPSESPVIQDLSRLGLGDDDSQL